MAYNDPDEVHDALQKLVIQVTKIASDVCVIKEEDLPRIEAQVTKTNGRVTELELSRATERGAALQRAATIEEVRQVRATDLARKAWVRPGVMALAATVMGALLGRLLG